jgi:acid phosphatase class B
LTAASPLSIGDTVFYNSQRFLKGVATASAIKRDVLKHKRWRAFPRRCECSGQISIVKNTRGDQITTPILTIVILRGINVIDR